MSAQTAEDPLDALRRLPRDAGGLIAEAVGPLDRAIRELGVPFRASHYAEDARDWGPDGCGHYQAHAGRFAFAIEAAEGRVTEYAVCAAEGPAGECGLYVSVCESHTETGPGEPGSGWERRHRVVIDRIGLARPAELSLSLQAQMIDELHQGNFLRAYGEHVRRVREGRASDPVHRPWLPGWSASV